METTPDQRRRGLLNWLSGPKSEVLAGDAAAQG